MSRTTSFLLLAILLSPALPGQTLTTKWTKQVTTENAHREYPRPQFVREKWQNLNGLWRYAIRPVDAAQPAADQFDGQILVPFPVESKLSGVQKTVGDQNRLWYRRTFNVPAEWSGQRVLLHFGAVDWHARVTLNGKRLGEHKGGYDSFSFDLTDALNRDGEQELIVSVVDPNDAGFQPRGKQINRPHGIWYTPSTGIWQTVWLEPVPTSRIESIRFTVVSDELVNVDVQSLPRNVRHTTKVSFRDGDRTFSAAGASLTGFQSAFDRVDWKHWSPDSPYLYDAKVELLDGDRVVDTAHTYFAMRTIALGKDEHGVNRLMLNGKPLFQYGLLDQGFWPDGLYTAPTDAAMRYDLEVTKQLGFNMVRKHVKVEPARWYRHCDELGLLVWQDMPSGDRHAKWDPVGTHNNTEATRSSESIENFNREWKAIIDSLRNHPCIVMWVPFNEGWGQANTVAVTKWTKEYDPTRLVNCASGGNDFPIGDVIDVHRYPGPFAPKPTAERAAVLGEFGGLGLPLEGHTWQAKDNWGYRSFKSREELNDAYLQLVDKLRPLIGQGLSAAIYTQTTDVEVEVNGLMTYDRAVVKLDADRAAAAHRKLYLPPPRVINVVPTAREIPIDWSFTTDKPADDWYTAAFDASSWKRGPGGFGEPSTPGSVVRTIWKTPDIWLRREIDIPPGKLDGLALLIHHDEDTEVFLDGKLLARTTGYTTDYAIVSLPPAAVQSMTTGKHMLAVHCHQTGGGQYIDLGLVNVEEVK